ncbi:MAG: RidA family protein [Pseudolabrys sp.]|nr:RidA family protein [Pseudolabrys sp.]
MSESGFDILQPRDWPRPQGYSNGVAASGRNVFIAGQIGWTAEAKLVSGGLVAQVEQALRNVVAVLAEAGGAPRHLVRLNWYVVDKAAYLAQRKEIGAAYRRVIGRHYPAMTLLVVAGLLEEGAMVEIEATAVVPE